MTIRFDRLLQDWYPRRDELDWVLGTIIDTQKSTYRKAGAMMLFNSMGQMYGMLSGGCLEGELVTQARKALMTNKVITLHYDLRHESDTSWQRGIGCGGAVSIILQPVTRNNQYLGLDQVHQALQQNQRIIYIQRTASPGLEQQHWHVHSAEMNQILFENNHSPQSKLITKDGNACLASLICPAPHLLIFGGGLDAQPLSTLAQDIGWQVTVADTRVAYAKQSNFPGATILKTAPDTWQKEKPKADAIVIMTHSLQLDAKALIYAQKSNARYIGILGPQHRREKVQNIAGINAKDFCQYYCGPSGLYIGATLPETIALSILSECHQVIEGRIQTPDINRKMQGAEI